MLFRRLLMLSLLAVPLAACVEEQAITEAESELSLDGDLATELGPEAAADPGQSCPNEQFTLRGDQLTGAGSMEERQAEDGPAQTQCVDYYFHPNNGAHGGYIESWRLCYRGGNQYQICRGGYAPVRYWNAGSCGGTVHDWYPQGWHGWVQSGGGCC